MAANDIVARYILKFDDLASKGLLGVAGKARIAALGLAGVAAAAGAAAVAAGGYVLNAAQKYSEFVDGLDEASAKMGVNINYLKDLRSAMGKAGVDAGQVDAGLTKFAVTLGKLKISGKALANVPPALQNQLKGAKDATEANKIALGYLSTITDATERAAVAAALYGKGAGPAFAGAVSDIDALNKAFARSRQITGVITPDAVKMASDYQDRLADMQDRMMMLKMTVGAAAIPALSGLIKRFDDFMDKNKDVISSGLTKFFDKFADAVEKIDWQAVGDGFIGLVEALPVIIPLLAKVAEWLPEIAMALVAINAIRFGTALVTGLGGVSKAIGMVAGTKGFGALANGAIRLGPMIARAAMAFGPWGLAAAGAAAGAYALYENWDSIGPMIGSAISTAGDYIMAFADTDWFAKGEQVGDMIANWFGSINWSGIAAWFQEFGTKISDQISAIDWTQLGETIGTNIANWFANVDWGKVGALLVGGIMIAGKIMLAVIKFIGGLAWKLLVATVGAAWGAIKGLAQAAWDGIKAAAMSAVQSIIDIVNALIAKWNAFAPSFAQVGTISGPASAQAADGVVSRTPGLQRGGTMEGYANVIIRNERGEKTGQARVPMSANGPRRPGARLYAQ